MEMGLPNATAERATFRWNTESTYSPQDTNNNPFDWTETPTTSLVKPDVQVPVAIEFSARPAGTLDTTLGQFDTARAVLTLLDTDYALVIGADQVLLGGNTYALDFWGPPQGLFSVTIYTAYLSALDEA